MEEASHRVKRKYTELVKRNLKKDLISYTPIHTLVNLASPLKRPRGLSNVHVQNKSLDPPLHPPICHSHPVFPSANGTTIQPNRSHLKSDSKTCPHAFTFFPSMLPPLAVQATIISCPDYFNSLSSACSVLVVTAFSKLIQIIAHLYLKCSNGFSFPLK